jgi:hypothetical protein
VEWLRRESRPWGVSANRLPRLDAEQVLHLSAIEASLRNLQAQFPQINKSLKSRRDTTDPSIVANMVAGYYFVDSVLAQHADLFAMGNPKLFLVLNSLVLCGHDQERAPGPHRTSQLPNGGFMIRRATAFAMSSNGTTFIGPTRHGGGLPGVSYLEPSTLIANTVSSRFSGFRRSSGTLQNS